MSVAEIDLYELLEIERTADGAAIKSAYRKLAMTHHPDRNGGDRSQEGLLRKVIDAYNQLRQAPAFA